MSKRLKDWLEGQDRNSKLASWVERVDREPPSARPVFRGLAAVLLLLGSMMVVHTIWTGSWWPTSPGDYLSVLSGLAFLAVLGWIALLGRAPQRLWELMRR